MRYNTTSLAIRMACVWAHNGLQKPQHSRWRLRRVVQHVRQRIALVKEELRLLRLKQRLMRPAGIRWQMQQDRSDRASATRPVPGIGTTLELSSTMTQILGTESERRPTRGH